MAGGEFLSRRRLFSNRGLHVGMAEVAAFVKQGFITRSRQRIGQAIAEV
jgi:hypothetical protein